MRKPGRVPESSNGADSSRNQDHSWAESNDDDELDHAPAFGKSTSQLNQYISAVDDLYQVGGIANDFTEGLTQLRGSSPLHDMNTLDDADIPNKYDCIDDHHMWIPTLLYMPTQNIQLFTERPRPARQPIASLMYRSLRSFPQKLLQSNMTPAFIHTTTLSDNSDDPDQESLQVCVLLVQMLNNSSRTAINLFWSNVKTECERICSTVDTVNFKQLLSALQALLIYILIRFEQRQSLDSMIDGLLVKAVIMASKHFNHLASLMLSPAYITPTWEDWILTESALRICVVYQVLNMLIYFEPASLCDLKVAPLALPSQRQIWEADSESIWHNLYNKELNAGQRFAMTINGKIVKLGADQACHGKNQLDPIFANSSLLQQASWEAWCTDTDSLGELAMLAASLVS